MNTDVRVRGRSVPFSADQCELLNKWLQEELEKRLPKQNGNASKFDVDDERFLIWVVGFTAGANLERDAERGERIFARCRDIHEKLLRQSPGVGGNAS